MVDVDDELSPFLLEQNPPLEVTLCPLLVQDRLSLTVTASGGGLVLDVEMHEAGHYRQQWSADGLIDNEDHSTLAEDHDPLVDLAVLPEKMRRTAWTMVGILDVDDDQFNVLVTHMRAVHFSFV